MIQILPSAVLMGYLIIMAKYLDARFPNLSKIYSAIILAIPVILILFPIEFLLEIEKPEFIPSTIGIIGGGVAGHLIAYMFISKKE